MHCAQEHNSHSFFPDVADHGEAAIKSEFFAVNLDLEAFITGEMSGLFCRRVPTIERSFSRRCYARGTLVKNRDGNF